MFQATKSEVPLERIYRAFIWREQHVIDKGYHYHFKVRLVRMISAQRQKKNFLNAIYEYCCDYILNFSLRAERKFPLENLLRCKNKIDAHARAPF